MSKQDVCRTIVQCVKDGRHVRLETTWHSKIASDALTSCTVEQNQPTCKSLVFLSRNMHNLISCTQKNIITVNFYISHWIKQNLHDPYGDLNLQTSRCYVSSITNEQTGNTVIYYLLLEHFKVTRFVRCHCLAAFCIKRCTQLTSITQTYCYSTMTIHSKFENILRWRKKSKGSEKNQKFASDRCRLITHVVTIPIVSLYRDRSWKMTREKQTLIFYWILYQNNRHIISSWDWIMPDWISVLVKLIKVKLKHVPTSCFKYRKLCTICK